uniref:CHXC5 n=1 Tax=Albugo laibachii Nc14 TaxID=890382 RepID=F0WFK3_9STRA|nr:CHXC5 [Albugo laibachii Nc14]|eukprot:CCA19985.1 CHXC5 [Albugo laibachii Nc14]
MSLSLSLGAVALAMLGASSNTFQGNDASFLSGILSVSPARRHHFTTCHDCIVRTVGITQSRLIKSTADFRMYWVVGHPEISTAFIWHCNSRNIGESLESMPQMFTLDYLEAHSHHQVSHETELERNTEMRIYQWAIFIALADNPNGSLAFKPHSQQSSQRTSAFMTNLQINTPVFFGDEPKQQPPAWTMYSESVRDKKTRIPYKQNSDSARSSLACMVILGGKQEAVCRECLSLHSEWLAIQTYHLFYLEKDYSAELCVFPSIYEENAILENCRGKFCEGMFAWNLNDCLQLDSIFPLHGQLMKKAYDSYLQNQNPAVLYPSGTRFATCKGCP